MFISVSDNIHREREFRKDARSKLLPFGIPVLDDALAGISPSDFVLVGAPSGIGKTQLCCNIALANIANGKTVHFIALEAEPFEIERRLKFQRIAFLFYQDHSRPHLKKKLSYESWRYGDFLSELEKYEIEAEQFMSSAYGNLFVFYKEEDFTINTLIENMIMNAKKSDLFIVDHAHYFDFDVHDDNENHALKTIAKTTRDLILEEQIPVVLVAHLRKKDRFNDDLVPGIDEFHGSSDLTKIATKVITLSPGGRTNDGCYETFFRIPKNRLNGGVNRFIARVMFDPKRGAYENTYKIGRGNLTRKEGFEELGFDLQPEWARRNENQTGF